MSLAGRLVRARWNVLRLVVACFLVWALAADTPGRLARRALSTLPDFDYAAEVRFLAAEGRYGEALMVADEGARTLEGEPAARLADARAEVEREQSSWLRRAREAGWGAITGRGDSIEGLVGAVAADFFVVGDVRDLVIQASRAVVDGEADPVIVALSGVGLATTIAPEVDWAPAVLKAARKSGAMTRGVADGLLSATRRGGRAGVDAVRTLVADVAALSKRCSPGGAVRALRHADGPGDVAALARFVERQPSGAFALHVLGGEAAAVAKASVKGAARAAAGATEEAVVLAARKGPAGAAWLRTAGRVGVRPHPLLGVAKAVYKDNAQKLAARVAAEIDPRAWWLLPACAAWAALELAWLARRVRRAP